ncbi:MAG: ctpB [Chloroflexi bacterium]|nr:ctpB [Chloroflexota bacterium]
MEFYVDPVDDTVLIDGLLRGIHAGAVDSGLLPLDADILDAAPLRYVHNADRDWNQLAARYDIFVSKVSSRLGPDEVAQAAARGMLGALNDDHTTFLDPRAVEAQRSRGYMGIGVTLSMPEQQGFPIVRETLPGSPAERSGLRVGDTILLIDGRSTSSLKLSEAVDQIRGPDGSEVTVQVTSVDDPAPREMTMVRAPVRLLPVQAEARGSVAYIRIRNFQDGVADAVVSAMRQSLSIGVQGWVFDLRGNGGGSIQEVVTLASLFVGDQVIGYQVDRTGRRTPIVGTGPAVSPLLPTVVLVDGETGSGSEVFAAAMREYRLAKVIGTRTAGRVGLAQVLALPDGSAAQITTRRILAASGDRLDGVGVDPEETISAAVSDWVQGNDPPFDRAQALIAEMAGRSAVPAGSGI